MSRVSQTAQEWMTGKLHTAAPRSTDKKTLGLLAWQHKNIKVLDLTKTEERVEREGLRAMCRLGMFPNLQDVEVPGMSGTSMLDTLRELKPTGSHKIHVCANKVISTNQAYMDQFLQMTSTMSKYWASLRLASIYIRKQEDFSDLCNKITESKRNGVPILADLVLDIPIQNDSSQKDNQTISHILNLSKLNKQTGRVLVLCKTMIANRVKLLPLQSPTTTWLQKLPSYQCNNQSNYYYKGTQFYDITCGKWYHRQLAVKAEIPSVTVCWQLHINFDNYDRHEDVKNMDLEIQALHQHLVDHVEQVKLQFSGTNVAIECLQLYQRRCMKGKMS
eukprot:TRINITY_DN95405_c1_g2_i1.p1 TRINITY_DN95405_c1_g2~~TRINITY_DN95405_c1_g2_i1.p1  ORF type:complete len:332 (-),score=17.84 TRINITY_DN95405_c1_g2_i1:42-1037(-)